MDLYTVMVSHFHKGGLNLSEGNIVEIEVTELGASVYVRGKMAYFYDFSRVEEKEKFEKLYKKN